MKQAASISVKKNFISRFKFRFTQTNDQCVGIATRFESGSSFFLLSLCRAVTGQPACVSFRQATLSPTGVTGWNVLFQAMSISSIVNDVWYDFEITTSGNLVNGAVMLADKAVMSVASLTVPTDAVAAWNTTANDVALWSRCEFVSVFLLFSNEPNQLNSPKYRNSSANLDFDDFFITTGPGIAELVYNKCNRCGTAVQYTLPWCQCCFYDCDGRKNDCLTRLGSCTADRSPMCFGTEWCPGTTRVNTTSTTRPTTTTTTATTTPAPTPPPTTVMVPQRSLVAPNCAQAGRANNSDLAAGSTCNACNQYRSATNGANCVWCTRFGGQCIDETQVGSQCSGAGAQVQDNVNVQCSSSCAPLPVTAGWCKFDPLQTEVIGGFKVLLFERTTTRTQTIETRLKFVPH
jgi:hypothetical protein